MPWSTLKLAFLVRPHVGGTYAVYRSLRAGAAAFSIDVRWVSLELPAAEILECEDWATESASGKRIECDVDDPARGAALVHHLSSEGYDGIIVNVLTSAAEMNCLRYLPSSLLRIMLVHNITPATYAAAVALSRWADAVVCPVPRIRDDLVRKGLPPAKVHVIPHGILRYEQPRRPLNASGQIHLASLGRIEDRSKGIFWLPRIARHLAGIDWSLLIGGDGPDLPELRRRFEKFGDRVRFVGSVSPAAVSQYLAEADVFVLPSRFEGFGLTLAEAMSVGCVPIASRIAGVTDFVLDHGKTGLLFRVGDTAEAAFLIRSLTNDKARLTAMRETCIAQAKERFAVQKMGGAYAALVRQLLVSPRPNFQPLPIGSWCYPRAFNGGIRRAVPTWIKSAIWHWKA